MNVYLFAHQDDEFFCIPQMRKDIENNINIKVIYLTSGDGGKASPNERNIESSIVLNNLGVSFDQIHFLGSELSIPDGQLYEHMSIIYDNLKVATKNITPRNIFIPCYEGGHQDHDVISWLALKLSKDSKGRIYQFPLYNGYKIFSPFFRVMKLIDGQKVSSKTMEFKFSDLLYLRHYKSQFKTWLGLTPFIILRLLLSKHVILIKFDPIYLSDQPHEGSVLYQRRTDVNYLKIKAKMLDFLEEKE